MPLPLALLAVNTWDAIYTKASHAFQHHSDDTDGICVLGEILTLVVSPFHHSLVAPLIHHFTERGSTYHPPGHQDALALHGPLSSWAGPTLTCVLA